MYFTNEASHEHTHDVNCGHLKINPKNIQSKEIVERNEEVIEVNAYELNITKVVEWLNATSSEASIYPEDVKLDYFLGVCNDLTQKCIVEHYNTTCLEDSF